MKKLLWLLAPFLVLSLAVATAAQSVYDNAALLTEEERLYLEELAATEEEKYGVSIVVLTENGVDYADPLQYAADFYDYGDFQESGVILLLDMQERDWRIVNSGEMMNAIGNYELNYIADYAISCFSDGDYLTGFEQYILLVSSFYDQYINGSSLPDDAYGLENEVSLSGNPGWEQRPGEYGAYYSSVNETAIYFGVAGALGVVVAFIVCHGFRKQLRSAVPENNASRYFDEKNVVMITEKDKFLYSRVTKIKKESDPPRSSGGSFSGGGGTRSFSGSSGRSHTGGGGKF